MNTTITVFRAGEWVGEISTAAHTLEQPRGLQGVVDHLTGRGVRPMPEKR